MKYIFFFISSLLLCINCQNEIYCRNPLGKEVDWYVVFLMPRSVSSDNKLIYAYFDDNSSSFQYHLYQESSFPPNIITSYVTNNKNNSNINYFFWNDDDRRKDYNFYTNSMEKAHSKGSLIYDKNNGVFLPHSLPRFPTRIIDNKILTELPSNAGYYGQHFLCISINKDTAENIVELLNYINIKNNASVKKDKVNKIGNIWVERLININNTFDVNYPKELKTVIKSKNGVKFDIISKNYLNKIVPYDTTLRQIYKEDFYIRTWILPKLADPICEKYSLFNVNKLKFGEYIYYKEKEHSKWAISIFNNIVCFGDLNHCPSQKNRGGNTICFENKALHEAMINTIYSIDSCSIVIDKL